MSSEKNPPLKSYKPGDLVLSTCGPYEPWPAVVLPYAYVPKDVLSKRRGNDKIAVKFLSDNTFYWNTQKIIQPLTTEKIEDFDEAVKAKKKKYDKFLLKAYGEAREYSPANFEDFLRAEGLLLEDEEFVEYENWNDMGESNGKKSAGKKQTGKNNKANSKSKAKEEDVSDSSSVGPQSKKRKTTTTSTKKSNQAKEAPTQEELENTSKLFRSKLQRALLQRKGEPSEEELKQSSKDLEDLEDFSPNINTELLKISKLHKVLKAIHKVESLKRPNDFKFHERSEDLLIKWESYIKELKNDKHARTDTPNSSILDTHDDTKTEIEESKLRNETNNNGKPEYGSTDFNQILKEEDGAKIEEDSTGIKNETEKDTDVKDVQ